MEHQLSSNMLVWESDRDEALPDPVLENCLISGIDVDEHGTIYVTVPRWKSGVPSTLNILTANATLQPYLSLAMQEEGGSQPGSLQNAKRFRLPIALIILFYPHILHKIFPPIYSFNTIHICTLYSIVIDSRSRMWVLEVGRRNYLMSNSADHVDGNAGVWIIDMKVDVNDVNTSEVEQLPPGNITSKYYFPEEVVDSSEGLLSSMVVDDRNEVAYLSDVGNGGIVIYNFLNQTSRRFDESSSFLRVESYVIGGVMSYFGSTLLIGSGGLEMTALSVSGLALSTDGDFLYYSAIQGDCLFRIPTLELRDFEVPLSGLNESIENLGVKPPSDAMIVVGDYLYFSSLSESTYYSLRLSTLIDRNTLNTEPLNLTRFPLEGNYSDLECFGDFCYNTTTLENQNLFINIGATLMAEGSASDVWRMRWINTFAADYSDNEKIWLVSNSLDLFITGTLDPSELSMVVGYIKSSEPTTCSDETSLAQLFENWMKPPHAVVVLMTIGATIFLFLEVISAGCLYTYAKYALAKEERDKVEKDRKKQRDRRIELAGLNSTIVHHPGGVSVGYHDDINSISVGSQCHNRDELSNSMNSIDSRRGKSKDSRQTRSSGDYQKGAQSRTVNIYDIEMQESRNVDDDSQATWRDRPSFEHEPVKPTRRSPSPTRQTPTSFLNSSKWSPQRASNMREFPPSKSQQSSNYLNFGGSKSLPTTPTTSKRKYFSSVSRGESESSRYTSKWYDKGKNKYDERSGSRTRSGSWGDNKSGFGRSAPTVATSYAGPPLPSTPERADRNRRRSFSLDSFETIG